MFNYDKIKNFLDYIEDAMNRDLGTNEDGEDLTKRSFIGKVICYIPSLIFVGSYVFMFFYILYTIILYFIGL
jgi:hypothetical protein